jgi:hypothetical protein
MLWRIPLNEPQKPVEINMGPKVRLLLGIRLAQIAIARTNGDIHDAQALVDNEPDNGYELTGLALKEVCLAIGICKTRPDCPHDNDEDIAGDILKGLGIDPETGQPAGGHYPHPRKTR